MLTAQGRLQLVDDEGVILKMYNDGYGNMTIGIGHNLSAKPITITAAYQIFDDDVEDVTVILRLQDWWTSLSPVRQDVMINAAFNMGVGGLLEFHHMIAHMQAGEWRAAAQSLMDSEAGALLTTRYRRLAWALRTNTWDATKWTDGAENAENWPVPGGATA